MFYFACCNMEYQFELSVSELLIHMKGIFNDSSNGPDGRYTMQPMAEGGFGFADLTPYSVNISYIGQVWHTTKNKGYNDTIDMTFAALPNKPNASILKIFSISQIGGAWCDDGQNYKNIAQLIKAVPTTPYAQRNIFGCPKSDNLHTR